MKLNEEFIEECNKRLAEKEKIYGGKGNPKNYTNMTDYELLYLILTDATLLQSCLFVGTKDEIKELCVDIANRCSMIWEIDN